jgi:hypothetical protein
MMKMKLRLDHVTNSSSSSFLIFRKEKVTDPVDVKDICPEMYKELWDYCFAGPASNEYYNSIGEEVKNPLEIKDWDEYTDDEKDAIADYALLSSNLFDHARRQKYDDMPFYTEPAVCLAEAELEDRMRDRSVKNGKKLDEYGRLPFEDQMKNMEKIWAYWDKGRTNAAKRLVKDMKSKGYKYIYMHKIGDDNDLGNKLEHGGIITSREVIRCSHH